jgi:2,4'-dihydroxyacetophenone dioxygenase
VAFYYGDGIMTLNGVRQEDLGCPHTVTVETAGTVHQPFASDTRCPMLESSMA